MEDRFYDGEEEGEDKDKDKDNKRNSEKGVYSYNPWSASLRSADLTGEKLIWLQSLKKFCSITF